MYPYLCYSVLFKAYASTPSYEVTNKKTTQWRALLRIGLFSMIFRFYKLKLLRGRQIFSAYS